MNRIKRTYIIAPLVILISVCLGIVFAYNFLIEENIEATVYDSIENAFNTRTNNFKTKVLFDYEYFDSLSEQEFEMLKGIDTDSYENIIDDYAGEKEINFDKQNQKVIYKITKGTKTYGIVTSLEKYIEHMLVDTTFIDEYYIGTKRLETIYSSSDAKLYLYDYFSNGLADVKDEVDAIQNNDKLLFEVKLDGEKVKFYSNKVKLSDTDYVIVLYKIVPVNDSKLVNFINTISWVLIICVILIFVVCLNFVFQRQNNHAKEMLLSIKKITGASSYVILTDHKGFIKNCNVHVQKDFAGIDLFKSIREIFERQDLLPNDLRSLKNFEAKVLFNDGPKYLHFYVTRTANIMVFIGEEITREYLDREQLKNLVLINPVTDRKSKIALEQDLKKVIETNKSLKECALIAFDVVHFNSVNKIFGRQVGDTVLNKIASTVEERIDSEKVTLYHTSEDKFFILINNLTNVETYAVNFVKDLITKFSDPIKVYNNLIVIQLKYGIYFLEDTITSADTAIDNVVMALKSAKNSRISDYQVYDIHIGRIITKDMQMNSDMVKAVENNEFKLFYQPQYDVKAKKIVGFEALIRWANPKYIGESPLKFIEMAEKNDLIIEIGKFVMDEAFKTAKQYEDKGISFSINVSPVQLLQSGFVNDLISTAEKYELKPSSVAIEITETIMMELFEDIIDKLRLIRSYGFEIHLDDFGTGYSSLLYLNSLPVNVIKIDKEFVRDLKEESTRLILSKVISMAVGLDLKVIAEGVETDKESQLIEKYGGQIIQGYLISKPVPADDVQGLIDKYNIQDDVSEKKTRK